MFSRGSRYELISTSTVMQRQADGTVREVRLAHRRFLPELDQHLLVAQHTVAPGERLDLLAARYLGDPTQYWRLCDANGVVHPDELEALGRVIDVAMKKG